MAFKHLTDMEIQDYLDDNLPQEQSGIVQNHIENCRSCQNELKLYRNLYGGLKEEPAFSLSPNFAASIVSRIEVEQAGSFRLKLWYIFLSILGIGLALGTTFYFVDFAPLIKSMTSLPTPQLSTEKFSVITNFLGKLNINLSLLIFLATIGLALVIKPPHIPGSIPSDRVDPLIHGLNHLQCSCFFDIVSIQFI